MVTRLSVEKALIIGDATVDAAVIPAKAMRRLAKKLKSLSAEALIVCGELIFIPDRALESKIANAATLIQGLGAAVGADQIVLVPGHVQSAKAAVSGDPLYIYRRVAEQLKDRFEVGIADDYAVKLRLPKLNVLVVSARSITTRVMQGFKTTLPLLVNLVLSKPDYFLRDPPDEIVVADYQRPITETRMSVEGGTVTVRPLPPLCPRYVKSGFVGALYYSPKPNVIVERYSISELSTATPA